MPATQESRDKSKYDKTQEDLRILCAVVLKQGVFIMQKKRRTYNAMAMIGCTMLICSVSGMGTNCKGIFYEPMAVGFGVNMAQVTLVSTLYGIVAALSVPVTCAVYRKASSKTVLPATVFLFCLCNYMMGSADSLTEIYIWGAIQGIPGGFIVFFPVQYIIGNWFPEKKGSVLGLVLMSTGVAGMIFNPVASGWIQSFGWQWAYRAQALIIFLVGFPAALFLLYKNPEEVGFIDPAARNVAADAKTVTAAGETTGLLTVIKLFSLVLMICISYGLVQHLPKYATDAGKTATFGALLVSMTMAGNLAFKIVLGWANDRFGAKKTTLASALSFVAGIALVISGNVQTVMMVGSFLMGAILAMVSLQIPLLFRSYCDPTTYEKVYPITCSANVLLCAASQNSISVLYQWLGGYKWVFILYILLMGVLCAVLLSLGKKKQA